MASILKVDDLRGNTAAGDITITSEGGSATMQLQQGVQKVWSNLNGTGTIAARDSFNVASYTDNGTGDYTHTFSSAMDNANYCWLIVSDFQAGTARNSNLGVDSSAQATGSIRLHTYGLSSGSANDYEVINCGISGDLA